MNNTTGNPSIDDDLFETPLSDENLFNDFPADKDLYPSDELSANNSLYPPNPALDEDLYPQSTPTEDELFVDDSVMPENIGETPLGDFAGADTPLADWIEAIVANVPDFGVECLDEDLAGIFGSDETELE